jgi:hypothetical protein
MATLPQNLIIPGPAGGLEAIFLDINNKNTNVFAIICHPHPLHGGTMNNKVVTTLARAMNELGLPSLRFNFRGVGASAGEYGHGDGETEDLLAVIAWVNQNFPEHKIWLAGFSFGSYIAMRGAFLKRGQVTQLITIAPAVTYFDFTQHHHIDCPWLLVMGEEDELVPIAEVKTWLTKLPVPIQTIFMPGVGHFFHGHLTQLREHLLSVLTPNLPHGTIHV